MSRTVVKEPGAGKAPGAAKKADAKQPKSARESVAVKEKEPAVVNEPAPVKQPDVTRSLDTIKQTDIDQMFSYDVVPYESLPFSQSHPDRMATIASLFGMKPAPVERCRVLELGCASGGNIIPLACTLPESEFIGVDLSKRQASDGQAVVKELGLKNMDIRHLNITDVARELGHFDYIISHGVFSWVPREVQRKHFQIIQEMLAPQGIAYISYNTYPGWRFRGMIRDMMLYHAGLFSAPQVKIAQSRALINWLAQSVPSQDNPYGLMLKKEAEFLQKQSDSYLLHEFLEEENEPVYFHQFRTMAGEYSLQYLGEAEFNTMLTSNFSKDVDETLRKFSSDIIRTEQYMDFVRNRTFRQTLLCHSEVKLQRTVMPESIKPLYIGSPAKPKDQVVIQSQDRATFTLPDGRYVTTAHPIVKAAFVHLSRVWPQVCSFDELMTAARASLAQVTVQDSASFERDAQILAADLLKCYSINLVTLSTRPWPFVNDVTAKPKVSDLARLQAKTKQFVTSQRHETIPLDFFGRQLVQLLDGKRTKQEVLEALIGLVKSNVLVIQKDGKPVTDAGQLRDILSTMLEEKLGQLRAQALLEA